MPAKKVIIGVGIASYPVASAGNTWAFLQWALGFRSLGWEVWVTEEIDAAKCVDHENRPSPFETSANLAHWRTTMSEFGFLDHSSLLANGAAPNRAELVAFAREADLLLNLSGHFQDAEILGAVGRRVYVDLDPAFTQIWAEVYHSNMNLAGHDNYVSVGWHLGQSVCRAPSLGLQWIPTLPPVNLDYWTCPESTAPGKNWTTVTHWYGYPAVEYAGEWYGNKSEEFLRLLTLPSQTREQLEVATDLTPVMEDYQTFSRAGWHLTPSKPISEPWPKYRDYLASSRGEFCVAKNGYVRSHCGWYSDRSVCYLALGRPVILQETGWSDVLPAGEGVLSFTDLASAAAALEQAAKDYPRHSRAARQIAERYCAAPVVISKLLENLAIA